VEELLISDQISANFNLLPLFLCWYPALLPINSFLV
jgi:hypothetical protein